MEDLNVVEHRDFFTACYSAVLPDIDNTKLMLEINNIKASDPGRKLTNLGGWQSSDILQQSFATYTEFGKLVQRSMEICLELYKLWQIGDTVYFDNAWVNVNTKHNFNLKHVHPRSLFTVVYYVKAPDNSGDILFYRPDTQEHYMDSITPNEYTNKKLQFKPRDSLLLLFPAYLPHFVYPNEVEEERVSIAINFK